MEAMRKNVAGEYIGEFGLCKDRHPYPVSEAIFGNNVPQMAFPKLELEARQFLEPYVNAGMKHLVVYLSGSNSAALAVYSAALKLHIYSITFMHFDAINEGYQAQVVSAFNNI